MWENIKVILLNDETSTFFEIIILFFEKMHIEKVHWQLYLNHYKLEIKTILFEEKLF